jgi:hypothetical protein
MTTAEGAQPDNLKQKRKTVNLKEEDTIQVVSIDCQQGCQHSGVPPLNLEQMVELLSEFLLSSYSDSMPSTNAYERAILLSEDVVSLALAKVAKELRQRNREEK